MKRFLHAVPSLFSALRLVFAFLLPLFPERWWIYFVIASFCSDVLDGWMARKLKAESWQGGLLDAMTDKVFVLVTLILLIRADKFSLWWLLPVITRDIMVAVTVAYAILRKEWEAFKEMSARIIGKVATGGQFLLFLVVLLRPGWTLEALFLASCCSIAAGFDYGRLFYQALRRTRR